MKACGNITPLDVKSKCSPSYHVWRKSCGEILTPKLPVDKDKWINKERQRWAHQFNIPCADKAPDGFPVSTLAVRNQTSPGSETHEERLLLTNQPIQAQRALTAISLTSPAQLLPATDALYNAIWGPNRNSAAVHTPAGLLSVLSSVIGEDQAKEMMASADAKKKLGEATDEALAKGAFGMPYFVATDAQGREETYWGFDHLGQVLQHMGLEKEGLGQGARSML